MFSSMQRKLHKKWTAFLDILPGVRRELYSHISNADTRYTNLSDNEKTKYVIATENKIISNLRFIENLTFSNPSRDVQKDKVR